MADIDPQDGSRKNRRMTHFSTKEAIAFSFSTYRKHFVLLAAASALMTGSLWLCSDSLERVAQQSGFSRAFDIATIAKEQGHPAGFKSVAVEVVTHLKEISIPYYASLLLVFVLGYALFFFLALGFMNLCLTLKDTGRGSLKEVFSLHFMQVKNFAGGAVLYFVTMFLGFLGAILAVMPVTMLCKSFLNTSSTITVSAAVCFCLVVAVLVWTMGYMFFGFCILDKPETGSIEALQMSAALSKGFRVRILKTLLAAVLVLMGPLMVLLVALLTIGKMLSLGDHMSLAVINFIATFITYPLSFLCCSYIYRSLQARQ